MTEEQGGSLCPWPGPSPFSYHLGDRTHGATHGLYQEGGIRRKEGAQVSSRLGSSWGRPTSGHLSHLCLQGVASPWPAPHSGQELCFLLSQVLRAEAQSFQHPKWHVALMGLGCLLDGKAAWARNHASIQLFPPTPNKGSVSNQAEHFTCLCLLKIYQLHSSSLEFLKGLGSL